MKLVFAYRNHENLGIGYLSSALKKGGHKTDLVMHFGGDPFFGLERRKNNADVLAKRILAKQPDLIALSTVTDDFKFISDVAREIKKRSDVPIALGGIHVTAVPERVIEKDFVDIISIGEGEESFTYLADRFEDYLKGKEISIPGIWYKKNGAVLKNGFGGLIQDLDSLPFPDKELFYKSAPFFQDEYLIVTSRGCPYKCSYCYNWTYSRMYNEEKKFRRRSVGNVIEELLEAKKKWKIQRIFFFDDAFTSDKKWILNFLERYKKEISLEFSCVTNANFIDRELAHTLKEAGCVKVCMGIETWNEKIRRDVLHRNDRNEKIVSSIAALKETGMYVQTDHLLGIPGESMQDHTAALKYYNAVRPNHISVYWMKYYPGIEIIDILKKRNVLSDDEIEQVEEGEFTKNSYLHKGSLKNPQDLFGINILLNYLPILPGFIVDFFIKIRLYNYCKTKSYFISNMIPKLIKTVLFSQDVSGRYYIKKIIFLLRYYLQNSDKFF